MQTAFVEAIRTKRLIRVTYEGQRRTAEPHVLGTRGEGNSFQVLAFQLTNDADRLAGPGWRYFLLSKIESFEVLDSTFHGRRVTRSYQPSQWKWIAAVVAP